MKSGISIYKMDISITVEEQLYPENVTHFDYTNLGFGFAMLKFSAKS